MTGWLPAWLCFWSLCSGDVTSIDTHGEIRHLVPKVVTLEEVMASLDYCQRMERQYEVVLPHEEINRQLTEPPFELVQLYRACTDYYLMQQTVNVGRPYGWWIKQ